MWERLDPHSTDLEQAFAPLHREAVQRDHPWSIAELRLSEDDTRWLREWFACLIPMKVEEWITRTSLFGRKDDPAVPHYQMLGALLVCAGAEICREESTEDSVWPAIRSILPESGALRAMFFLSNGQPSSLTKDAIADAVRALNLRHAMDIEGTQQWFVTVKLQFGFTYRGAKNRLAEWLVNLGRPHAVQYLDGESGHADLTSESFQSMWRALRQYRRGLITEDEVRTTLQRLPWVRAHWIDDLLQEATAKIATLGTGEQRAEGAEGAEENTAHMEEISEDELHPIAGISLEWPTGGVPRLRLNLDRFAIEGAVADMDLTELDFYVDGARACRWLRQRDGSWAGLACLYAEQDKGRQQPNLSPRTLLLQARSGQPVAEWDLADSGLMEEVLVFDLGSEGMVSASSGRLEANRRYAVICEHECKIEGAAPVEVFERPGLSRKVVRLPSPLSGSICVSYGDFVVWQPVRPENEERPHFSLALTTPSGEVFSLNDRTWLSLEGLPEDAANVALLIRTRQYELRREDGSWRTLRDIQMTPELAARERRVRVRFSSGGRAHSQEPRLELHLLGVAMLHHMQRDGIQTVAYEVLGTGKPVNCSEGSTYLRIWTPEHDDGAPVLEGDCRVGPLRHHKVRLRDVPGHGGELHIVSHGERHNLGVVCWDTGCVRAFVPAMLRNDAQVAFLSDKEPAEAGESGYTIHVWSIGESGKASIQRLPDACIQAGSRARMWKVSGLCDPMAIALTWKGLRLGAWWNLERIRDYVARRGDLSEQDFAVTKWLRVPALHPEISPTFARAIVRSPCRFIRTWLGNKGLPEGLIPCERIEGLDAVVRHFLWNDFPPMQAKDAFDAVAQWDGSLNQMERCIHHLRQLSDVSPVLLWKGLEHCLKRWHDGGGQKGAGIVALLQLFAYAQLGLPSNPVRQLVDLRLRSFQEQVTRATGMSRTRIEEITRTRLGAMRERQWPPLEQDRSDLLKLGETHSGRKYLSARMTLYWLEMGGAGSGHGAG